MQYPPPPQSAASQRWDKSHACNNKSVPSHLYTDENPATTIKGTGFKDASIAQRTITLTSQSCVRYKQYWTIRAMRERAANHPHPTTGMRDAIAVFDEWLSTDKEPTGEEKREQQKEWEAFHKLCQTDANQHSYGKEHTKEDLDRARKDVAEGQSLLYELLSSFRPNKPPTNIKFPLTSFVAVFGGPGLHGYGKHSINIESHASIVDIDGLGGVEELIGSSKSRKLTLSSKCEIQISYNRKEETVSSVNIHQNNLNTLESLWGVSSKVKAVDAFNKKRKRKDEDRKKSSHSLDADRNNDCGPSWACNACTYVHHGIPKVEYLACEVCGSLRERDLTQHKMKMHI